MLKKFISILAMTAIFVSFIPAMSAEEESGISAIITFADDYSVIGDILGVTVQITSDKEETEVPVLMQYGEEKVYEDKIDLKEDNEFKFEETKSVTVGTPDKFTVTVNGKAFDKEIVKKDAYEIGDITAEYKQTVTEEETDYLEYSVKTAVTNNRNVKTEKFVVSYGTFATEEFDIDAKSSAEKDFTVKIKKSDITEEKLDGKLKLTVNGEDAAEKDVEFKNPYYVSKITINDGKKITLEKDKLTTPKVSLEPDGTICGYEISLKEDETIVSVSEDKKSITGIAAGKTEITVTAGDKTATAQVEVLKDRTTAEPENIRLYYYKTETNKTEESEETVKTKTYLEPSESFIYATKSYVITLPQDFSDFDLYYEITGGATPGIKVTKTNSDRVANVVEENGEKYISWNLNWSALTFTFKDENSAESSYTFIIGKAPEIKEFPKEISVYSDFDKTSDKDFTFTFSFNGYTDDDGTDMNKVTKVVVTDETGAEIGKYSQSGDADEAIERYWKYEISKTVEEGTKKPVTFTFSNKYGMETVCDSQLVYSEDTEDPNCKNMTVTVSSVKISSATIEWTRASDNDQVDYYEINYGKGSSGSGNTVKVNHNSDDKKYSKSISSLSSGTTYTVYIVAYDRTGNSAKSDKTEFTTSKSSSSSGGSSGSSSSSNWSGAITPNAGTNSGTASGTSKFTDIETYTWAKNEIETLAAKGIISGISDNEYGPAMSIRRCDFILLLVRAYGFNGTFEENFSDVPSDAYYAQAVGLAKKLGIVTGMGNNEFNPNGYITRQDMCVMALRAMQVAGKKTADPADLSKFNDSADIAEYAKEAIATLVASGIINGDENGNVNPRKNTTRAESAVIIYRLLGL